MRLCKKAVLVSLVVAATLSTGCAGVRFTSYSVPEDARGIIPAAAEFARQDFPENPPSEVTIVAMNDLMLESGESMANAVIIAEWPNQKRAFTVAHIHFTEYGTLVSGAGVFWWRTLERDDNWKDSWCNFLRTSMDRYKEELKTQGCE